MPLVVWAYSALSDRLRRDRLFLGVLASFFAVTLAFWGLLRTVEADWPSVLFYFYVDTYVTVAVAMFWSYVNEVSTVGQAKRLYGVIGAGGIAGGMVGSAASAVLSERLGDELVLVTLPFLAVAAGLVVVASRALGAAVGKQPGQRARGALGDALAGARLVAGSPYLLSIAGVVLVYELISTNVDYIFNALSDQAYPDRDAMAAFQGKVFFWANLGALVTQVFAVSWVHQRLGVRAGLLVLPLVLLVGSVAFMGEPMLIVASLLIGLEGTLSYSMHQSSKEVLYTPTDRATTYKAKAFIDMFVFRTGKAIGGVFLLVYGLYLVNLGMDLPMLAAVNIALLVLWMGLVGVAGRHFAQLAAREEARPPALAPGKPTPTA
jgi:AAA family ATP:ADP antiporter